MSGWCPVTTVTKPKQNVEYGVKRATSRTLVSEIKRDVLWPVTTDSDATRRREG